MTQLISIEATTIRAEELAEHESLIERLSARRAPESVHLFSRLHDLHKQIRRTHGWAPTWQAGQQQDFHREFLRDILRELTVEYDRGLQAISVAAHDRIVRDCIELSTERRKVAALRLQLAEKTAELAAITNATLIKNATLARFAAD